MSAGAGTAVGGGQRLGAAAAATRARVGAAARACLGAIRRIPRAGRICFLLAFVNVAIWGVIVPPFMVPDETTHFAYAQYFAETGHPPRQVSCPATMPECWESNQEEVAIQATWFGSVYGSRLNRGIFTNIEQQALRKDLAAYDEPLGLGGASVASNQPPLYYALEAIPYWLSPSNDLLTRLAFMRLLSALMAAGTVLAIFMFLRELLPRTPWAWTVGALMVAFQPMFAFMGAGVNGDNLLFLASALTFFTTARAWQRGLTMRRSAAIGGALAIGMLAKLTFLALVPGAALALLLLAWRARPAGWVPALQRLALGVGVAAAPVALYLLLNATVWSRGSALAGGLSGISNSVAAAGTPAGQSWHRIVDYAWELYLPRLPFMNHVYFPTGYPLWTIWLNGSIGLFGWLNYGFPGWVYDDFRIVVYALAALGAVGLWRVRAAVRPLLGLFACYGLMALVLLAVIGYLSAQAALNPPYYLFAQARYLFPLLALYALAIVLATKALPPRWAPVLGALLVALAMAHNLFAQTLTISRFYG
jgi:4-amino-4-deoxy-L-arabinose transferase-like glycosyltransferase